jgi:alpha-beta hydrolase superfamily lysophospholipase
MRLAFIVAGLFVAFHLGAGWVFAGQINGDGLEPKAPARNYGVTVDAVEGDLITLGGDDEALDDAGAYGLVWDDGFGHVGEVESATDGAVRRPFVLIEGESPPMGPIEVDLDAWMYPTDPGDASLAFADNTYDAGLGPMDAWYVPSAESVARRWAIHIHGWRADRRETIRLLPLFAASGIDSLVIEYRNDSSAPADPSGLYRFGRTEWEDVEAAVRHALDQGAEEVVLVGYSTGAAAAMSFVERSPLAGTVAGAVFDAPNIDFGRVVKTEAQNTRLLPGLPFTVPPTVTATAMAIADVRFDVDWGSIDYVGRAGDWDTPTLVFHGDADGTVPLAVSEDFAATSPDLVELVVIEGADHVTSWNVDRTRYETELLEFLASL